MKVQTTCQDKKILKNKIAKVSKQDRKSRLKYYINRLKEITKIISKF